MLLRAEEWARASATATPVSVSSGTRGSRSPDNFADLIALLPEDKEAVASAPPREGFVYLLKSGNHYKIGRSEAGSGRPSAFRIHTRSTEEPPWRQQLSGALVFSCVCQGDE